MKRALMVGVNNYKNAGSAGCSKEYPHRVLYDKRFKGLSGCITDVHDIAKVCSGMYGFQDIQFLINAGATYEAVTSSLKRMVSNTEPGDDLFFYFSGHGTQLPDLNGDEVDGLDECLVVHDHSWSTPFTDDHFATCLSGLNEEVYLTVILDACHSGDMLDPSNKNALQPEDVKELVDKGMEKKVRVKRFGVKNANPSDQRHVLFSGCQASGISLESQGRGLFTRVFCNFIRSKRFRFSSWSDLYKPLRGRIYDLSKQRQTPTLIGRKDLLSRPIFGKKK